MLKDLGVQVARQPIFDVNLDIFGYELLYRSSFVNHYDGINGDQATLDVIRNSFLRIGIDTLTNGKRAFINFTTNCLKNNLPVMLPKEILGVEILEDVLADEEIINVCQKLKQNGYLLVLDDFVFTPERLSLVELADIIKIDFRTTSPKDRRQLLQRLRNDRLKFLAEKIEKHEEFQEALHLGFSYFQGYFLSKPSIIASK